MILDLQKYEHLFEKVNLTKESGKITEVTGVLLKGYLPSATLGSLCQVFPLGSEKPFFCEVVGFKDRDVMMMPLGEMRGVGLGAKVILAKTVATVKAGEELLGRVLNASGDFLDSGKEVNLSDEVPLYKEVVNPLFRKPIHEPLDLGIRAINGLLTVGRGQRIGIMAGSGVGKSVLLGMMARYTNADVNIIALIGERGREVREFIEKDLGEEGLKKSIVIVASSDQSPLLRMRGAFFATSLAEYFSSQGKQVLLMMDSVTRFAMAQREIGLSVGEPPASKGYTPSVFSLLPKLLERAGSFEHGGSITGLYTVLVEGDDMDDPIGDSVRSIVDGHFVLNRSLAQKGHYPAIDVLQSASRVMRSIIDPTHLQCALKLRENLAVYRDAEDLINIGAYKQGSNRKIDEAIHYYDSIIEYLRQTVEDGTSFEDCLDRMCSIFNIRRPV